MLKKILLFGWGVFSASTCQTVYCSESTFDIFEGAVVQTIENEERRIRVLFVNGYNWHSNWLKRFNFSVHFENENEGFAMFENVPSFISFEMVDQFIAPEDVDSDYCKYMTETTLPGNRSEMLGKNKSLFELNIQNNQRIVCTFGKGKMSKQKRRSFLAQMTQKIDEEVANFNGYMQEQYACVEMQRIRGDRELYRAELDSAKNMDLFLEYQEMMQRASEVEYENEQSFPVQFSDQAATGPSEEALPFPW